jgi:glycine/serine hydroxymethyltransferase
MKQIAVLIVRLIANIGNPDVQLQVREEVDQICHRFPVPGIND